MLPSWKHNEQDENEKSRNALKFLRKLGKVRLTTESNVIAEEDEDESPQLSEP
jgi:hypothetical protein